MGDRLPIGVSGNPRPGSLHKSAGSTCGSTSRPFESSGTGCGSSNMSSRCNVGAVSVSGLLDNPVSD